VNKTYLKISAVVAAMALIVPAASIAKGKPEDPGSKGKGHAKKTKLVTANVTGAVVSNDGETLVVTVAKASGHAKACKGKDLSFDISGARFWTADNDADGDMDAADVLVGHVVKVRGKVALSKGRKLTCGPEGLVTPAKAVHNRTTPKPADDDEVEGTETEETPAS
jgi:hypothetical protein